MEVALLSHLGSVCMAGSFPWYRSAALENIFPPLIFACGGTLATSSIVNQPARGNRSSFFDWGIWKVYLSVLRFTPFWEWTCQQKNFYFSARQTPKWKYLIFLFFMWWGWSINEIIVSQILNPIELHSPTQIFLFCFLKNNWNSCALWCICFSLNYFRTWVWRLNVFVGASDTSFT